MAAAFRRIGLSLVCVIASIGIWALLGAVSALFHHERVSDAVAIQFVALIFAIPVWPLSWPFVVAFKSADSWRAYAMLLIGTALGPGSVLALGLITEPKGTHITFERYGYYLIAASTISLIATILYVVSLRTIAREDCCVCSHPLLAQQRRNERCAEGCWGFCQVVGGD